MVVVAVVAVLSAADGRKCPTQATKPQSSPIHSNVHVTPAATSSKDMRHHKQPTSTNYKLQVCVVEVSECDQAFPIILSVVPFALI